MIGVGTITIREAIGRGTDPDSGARIKQLTSAPIMSTSIYCEVPFMDASSRYVVFDRQRDSYGPAEYWRADLATNHITPICEGSRKFNGAVVSTDQRFFYCLRNVGASGFEVLRTDIVTLEQESRAYDGLPIPDSMATVGPDHRFYIYGAWLGGKMWGVVRLDLETGEHKVIDQGADLVNSHPQIEPGQGVDVMIQHNRGAISENGEITRLVGEEGATIYLIGLDGGPRRALPVGKPHTLPCMGHQAWIGSTGEIILTTCDGPRGQMIEQGNLLAVRPGDEHARVIAGGYVYGHPNASRDGRFFVSDTFEEGDIIVGSIGTGRTRLLCRSGSSQSWLSPQWCHPHPYLSPDNRWVIFTSDATGIAQLYAAEVPDGFLEELDNARQG